jgi:hypothetical protein
MSNAKPSRVHLAMEPGLPGGQEQEREAKGREGRKVVVEASSSPRTGETAWAKVQGLARPSKSSERLLKFLEFRKTSEHLLPLFLERATR